MQVIDSENQPTPHAIMQIGFGFWSSKILLSAVEMGLFTYLAKNPKTSGKQIGIAFEFKCSERHVYDYLDSLVGLGFLQREGLLENAQYHNSRDTDYFLDKAKKSYIGGVLQMANNRLYKLWESLDQTLKSGIPPFKAHSEGNAFDELYKCPEKLTTFVNAMEGLQAVGFSIFAQKFDFSKYSTLVDAGGSGANLSIAVAKKNPHMKCVSLDLAPVQPIAKANIERQSLGRQVTTHVGNFFKQQIPKADVVVMGNILHDWNLEQKKSLVKNAFESVNSGGAFVAIENVIDEDRRKNVLGLQMSINMLLETEGGFDYTFSQFTEWTKGVGFTRTQLIHLQGGKSAAIAYK